MPLIPCISDDTAREILSDLNISLPGEQKHSGIWLEACAECQLQMRVAVRLLKACEIPWQYDWTTRTYSGPEDTKKLARRIEAVVALWTKRQVEGGRTG